MCILLTQRALPATQPTNQRGWQLLPSRSLKYCRASVYDGSLTCTSAGGPPCTQLTFDPNTNRIASIGNQTPTYDNDGEMTSDGTGTGTTQYTWTGRGRVATVTPWGGTPTTYLYDAEGNRVEDATANRLFWYGASGKLLETTDAGTTNHDYIYFAGRRIARHDSSGAVYYLYDDANGSLRTATDASGTQLCWADYYPFGEPVAGTGCSMDNYQFAGLYADATGEDGNYSAAHRRYNYSYYRWLSPDPGGRKVVKLDNPQTWNMYDYAGDNPITLADPSGLAPQGPLNQETEQQGSSPPNMRSHQGKRHGTISPAEQQVQEQRRTVTHTTTTRKTNGDGSLTTTTTTMTATFTVTNGQATFVGGTTETSSYTTMDNGASGVMLVGSTDTGSESLTTQGQAVQAMGAANFNNMVGTAETAPAPGFFTITGRDIEAHPFRYAATGVIAVAPFFLPAAVAWPVRAAGMVRNATVVVQDAPRLLGAYGW